MSASAKGYLLTPVKDVALVMNFVERVIEATILSKLSGISHGWILPKGYKRPETQFSPAANRASTVFQMAGETYMVMTHFGQDEDDTYPGEKVIFQMYQGPLCESLIPAILEKMTFLGECYFQESDERPLDPNVRIVARPLTYMDAVINQFSMGSAIRSWIRAHTDLQTQQPLHEFLGILYSELEDYLIDHANVFRLCSEYKTRANRVSHAQPA